MNNLHRGIAAFGNKQSGPDVVGFLIETSGIAYFGGIDGGVKSVGGQAPAFDHQFPGPLNGFLFEIIAERPISEHFKKRVMISVVAHILEVVVLATRADALLGVGGARRIVGGFFHPEEIRHKGIHPGVGEQQAGRLREQRCRGHDAVLFFPEKIEETLADFGCVHRCGSETIMIPQNWQGDSSGFPFGTAGAKCQVNSDL